jgi:putative transposase
VLETALEAELTEELGYEPHEAAGRNSGNSRNGTRSKTVLTEVGPVEIDVPRDRNGTFEPKLVRKRQRRLSGVDDLVISLVAKGLTTGCGVRLTWPRSTARRSPGTRCRASLTGSSTAWPSGRTAPWIGCVPGDLHRCHLGQNPRRRRGGEPADLHRGGRDRRRARDILGLWAGTGGEGAKFWLHVRSYQISIRLRVSTPGSAGRSGPGGHFPNEQAALKCLFLTIVSLDPTGTGRQRWMNRWKAALYSFGIAFPGRIVPSTK